MRGKLIVLEGIDGAGKGTQILNLRRALTSRAAFYKFPDRKSVFGRVISSFLGGKIKLSKREQIILYLADMFDQSENIRSDLSRGKLVFLDRYYTSTLAYQAHNDKDWKFITNIVSLLDLPAPDLIVYIDINPMESFKRRKRRDVLESDISFLHRVVRNYRKMMDKGFPMRRWVVVDGTINKKDIADSILRAVGDL